MEKKNEGNVNW